MGAWIAATVVAGGLLGVPTPTATPAGAAEAVLAPIAATVDIAGLAQGTLELARVPAGTAADAVPVTGRMTLGAPQPVGALVLAIDVAASRTPAQQLLRNASPVPRGVVAFGATAAIADMRPLAGEQPLATPNLFSDLEVVDGIGAGGLTKYTPRPVNAGVAWEPAIRAALTVTAARTSGIGRIVLYTNQPDPAFADTPELRAALAGHELFVVATGPSCPQALEAVARATGGACFRAYSSSFADLPGARGELLGRAETTLTSLRLDLLRGGSRIGTQDVSSTPAMPVAAPAVASFATFVRFFPGELDELCLVAGTMGPTGSRSARACQKPAVLPSFLTTPWRWLHMGDIDSAVDATGQWMFQQRPSAVTNLLTGARTMLPAAVGGPGATVDRFARRVFWLADTGVVDGSPVQSIAVHDRDADGDGTYDDAGGTSRTTIVPPGPWTESVLWFQIADHGRSVVYVTSSFDGPTTGRTLVHDLASGVTRELSPYREVTDISADGRWVALANTQEVRVVDRDTDSNGVFDEPGFTATKVLARDAAPARLSLSGNGGHLAFSSTKPLVSEDSDATADVYVADVATGALHLVTAAASTLVGHDAISDDGRRVAVDEGGRAVVIDRDADADGIMDEDRAGGRSTVDLPGDLCSAAPSTKGASLSRNGQRAWFVQDASELLRQFSRQQLIVVPARTQPVPVGLHAGPAVDVDEGTTVQRSASVCAGGGAQIAFHPGGDLTGFGSIVSGNTTVPLTARWLDDADHSMGFEAQNGTTASLAIPVRVRNVAPDVEDLDIVWAGPAGVDTQVSVTSTFEDPGLGDTHVAHVDWGDGTTTEVSQLSFNGGPNGNGNGSISASHAYATPGQRTIRVTISDDDGGEGSIAAPLDVPGAAPGTPVLSSPATATVREGLAVITSTFTDADSTNWTTRFDPGTGEAPSTPPVLVAGSVAYVQAVSRYPDDGSTTATLTVTDEGGRSASAVTAVTVVNADPTVSLTTAPERVVPFGGTVSVRAAVDDAGLRDTHTATIEWGDGSSSTETVRLDRTISAHHVFTRAGENTVTVRVVDDDGGSGTTTFVVDVLPPTEAPVIDAGGAASVPEGSMFSRVAQAQDPDGTAVTEVEVDWGDGSMGRPTVAADGSFPLEHRWADDGSYDVVITAYDEQGDASSVPLPVEVVNVAPQVDPIAVSGGARVGEPAHFAGTFSDPGLGDLHTATFDPGDGSGPVAATVGGTPGARTLEVAYTYLVAGSHTATFTVRDDDGGTTTASVVVHTEAPPSLLYTATIQQPINAAGDSIFRAGRGSVPVKWRLQQDGQATCALPTATIAVRRIANGTSVAVNEATFTGAADTGSTYRSGDCQYHYNLSAQRLSAGEYEVALRIDGGDVATARFGLR